MNFSRVAIIGLSVISSCVAVEPSGQFARPHSHLGASNYEGKVYQWIEIGDFPVSEDVKLPFRLLFSALPPSGGKPLFGKFWWCPLFESTLVAISERTYRLSLLGGGKLFLVKNKDGTISSTDGAWKGQSGPTGEVKLDSPDGWAYVYRGGRLAEASFKNSRLRWNYQNNQFKSITKGEQGSLVSVESGAQGLPTRIVTPSGTFECGVQKVPTVVNTGGAVMVSGFEFGLAGLTSGTRAWDFPITLSPEGNYAMKLSAGSQTLNTFVWQAETGILISEGAAIYKVVPRTDAPPLVSRKNAQGKVETYDYDQKTGASEHLLPDGRRIVRTYFTGRSPVQYKIRKMVTFNGTKEVKSTQWSYDELGRMIREKTGDLEKTLTYYPNGDLESQVETYKDKPVESQFFDAQGRLTKKFRRGVDYLYSYEQGKTILQRIQNGKLTLSSVSDPESKQDFVFLPEPDSGRLSLPGTVPNASTTVQDVEAAKVLAYKAIEKIKSEKTN